MNPSPLRPNRVDNPNAPLDDREKAPWPASKTPHDYDTLLEAHSALRDSGIRLRVSAAGRAAMWADE